MTLAIVALCFSGLAVTQAVGPGRPLDPEAVSSVESESELPEGSVVAPSHEESPEPGDAEVGTHLAPGNAQGDPPYYGPQDEANLRVRYGLPPERKVIPRKAKWDCWIADPVCGFNVELNTTGAFAGRFRQGDVRRSELVRWVSGRAQYDVWVNFPVLVETVGRVRYTRMSIGPKVGATFSDTGDTWGSLGSAMRVWLGRGRWAPSLEFTSALTFKLARRSTSDLGGAAPKYEMQRGPVGVTADIGVGIGGFGAIIFGGQYDSPLARHDVPEKFRTSAAGMMFVGFRGNIAWGGPAAVAIAAHGLTQRYVHDPK